MPQWTAKSLSAATKTQHSQINQPIYFICIYIKIYMCNWFLIYSQNCANIITVNLETSHLLKVTLYPLTAPHSLPISSSLKQPLIYCLCGFAYSRLSCEWNHIVCDLLWLLSFNIMFSRFIHVSGLHSFLWLNNIPS